MTISVDWLLGFLLILARVAGVLAFLPLPGASLFPATAKAAVSLLLSVALATATETRVVMPPGLWTAAVWMAGEAAFGVSVGLALQLLSEMLGLAAQMLGFQAGYSYINMIDPSTQVDATILNVLLTLLGGLLFFAFDLDLHLFRALARSLETAPAGTFVPQRAAAQEMVRLGGAVFESAVRLAFPVIALLLLLDLALALMSFLNARMQLLSLSFPVKMLVTMASLYVIVGMAPGLYRELARQALGVVHRIAAGAR